MKAVMMSLAIVLSPTWALAMGVAPEKPLTKVVQSKLTRALDCKGGDLTVEGDDDVLNVAGCAIINVVGNRNKMTVHLLPQSRIAALGDNNHIVFIHAPGFEARATSTGTGNEIVPQMGRDLNMKSSVKFPIGAGKP
jgi:hypothetical protein